MRWFYWSVIFGDVDEDVMRALVLAAGAALSVLGGVTLAPLVERAPGTARRAWAGFRGAVGRFAFWICSPSAVPVLRAVLVAALVLIALCLVVIACVLVF